MIPPVRWPSTKYPLLPRRSSSSSGNVRSLITSLATFYTEQVMSAISDVFDKDMDFSQFCKMCIAVFVVVAYIKPRSIRFGVPAIFTLLAATLNFLTTFESFNIV
ncbi:hypothetical protein Pyn_28421 [Prunus yedoensis var. nudiflora]|uniref:Uncharacterized protein n=1 Tax=Prunus yedoensis var. nudiflora TaxID=2094558 RepID=A0A314XWJ7_PRUYE|nr:hypothetical protein Pyn_28421 [Prunus yedoensis var. nudiflora]